MCKRKCWRVVQEVLIVYGSDLLRNGIVGILKENAIPLRQVDYCFSELSAVLTMHHPYAVLGCYARLDEYELDEISEMVGFLVGIPLVVIFLRYYEGLAFEVIRCGAGGLMTSEQENDPLNLACLGSYWYEEDIE